jgi:hypothetical protein
MRDIIDVINEVEKVAPDLSRYFKSLKTSSLYTAPEIQIVLWNRFISLLNTYAGKHPEKLKIQEILFGGE